MVAKGVGTVALKIREEAERNSVPIVEDKLLARTLHRLCEIGDEVPAELYEAVARILAFIFSLKAKGRTGGFHRIPGTRVLA